MSELAEGAVCPFCLGFSISFTSPVLAFEDKDCSDFATWEEAQRFYEENGGPAEDPHRLDGPDKDGLVCESLPGFNPNHKPGSFVGGGNKPPQQKPPATMSAKVLRVIDGDTIEVKLNGKTEDVRFLLIDTPETKHPQKGVQPCGPEAAAFTKRTFKSEINMGGFWLMCTKAGNQYKRLCWLRA